MDTNDPCGAAWLRYLGGGVAEVSGFFYPRTATGRSSLLPPPPWHYSGEVIAVDLDGTSEVIVNVPSLPF